jgi:cytochrome c oxidase assembly protein subunit 11
MTPLPPAPERARLNLTTLAKLCVLVTLMFGFGFAMIPIYKKICEITGVNFLTREESGNAEIARNTQVDTSRVITVEFDANHQGAWQFKPERRSIEVHPGELVTIDYELINGQSREMSGQAIPSYAPAVSAEHFRKIECFCFRQQTLGPNETRRFPVVFMVDPKLPANVSTITLSYTFFEVGAGMQPQLPQTRLSGAGREI